MHKLALGNLWLFLSSFSNSLRFSRDFECKEYRIPWLFNDLNNMKDFSYKF